MAVVNGRERFGLNQIYPRDGSSGDTSIDIIAIHGLDTGSPRTWVAYEIEDTSGPRGRAVNWLSDEDMLPNVIPEARVFTYDYTANYHVDAPVETLLGHADTLLKLIDYEREKNQSFLRPLIFIASCFGGLVLAEALNRAAVTGSPHHTLLRSTVGVVFLATPLRGSRAAPAAQWRVFVSGIMGNNVSDKLIRDLDAKTGVLEHLVRIFAENANASWLKLPIHCFYETQRTEILRSLLPRNVASMFSTPTTNRILVDEESACIQGFDRTGLRASHALMNKYRGPEDTNFKLVAKCLRDIVRNAPGVMDYRNKSDLYRGEASKNVHWLVPRAVNNLFTGRTEVLNKIKNAICSDQKTHSMKQQQRFVITGMGGQGKSEVCLKIADMVRQDFWGVFWVDLSSNSVAKTDFIALARLLGSSVESIDEARHLLANIQKNWLLILDNADDPEFDYQIYFPSGTWGTIIMTSRVVDTHHYQTVGTERLASLDEGDSLGLLFKVAKIPSESWSSQEQAAKEVIKTLGHHTLALIQAGAYIAKGHCSMEEFPGVFQGQRERLLNFRPKQAQSRYSDVFTTFEATASMLKSSGTTEASDALCLLEVVSMLHFSEIPMQIFEDAWKGSQEIIEAGPKKDYDIRDLSEWHVSQLPEFLREVMDKWDPFRLREASHLLASLSLITESTRDGFLEISMHSLVHAWVKDRLSSEERNRVWSMTGSILALSFYISSFWKPYYRQLQPHAHIYVNLYVNRMYSLNQNRSIAKMILWCGWGLHGMREDTLVAELLKRLFAELRIDPSYPSLESMELLDLYDLQGRTLYRLEDYKQAVQLFEQIFHIRQTTLAEDHSVRLTAQHDLATAYLENGQIVQAVQSFEHIIDKARQKLAEDDSYLLAYQHELARAYEMNGQINEAIQLLEHVVNVQNITLTEDYPNRLTSQLVLARAYRKNDRIREAIQLLEHVVKIRRTTLIESHSDRLTSEHELAVAYHANNQVEKAVQLFEHIIKIKESKLTEDDSSLLRSQHELAVAYKANDQIEKAVQLLEHVVKIDESTLAEDDSSRLRSQHELAVAYEANDQIEKSVQLLEHVVNIRKTTLTEDHPELLASEDWLVAAYRANGQIREATQLLEHLNQIVGTSLDLDDYK